MAAMGKDIEHLQERFAPEITDEEWMPRIAGQGLVVLSTDRRIYDRDSQRKIAREHGLSFILLAPSFEQQAAIRQLELRAHYWPEIEKRAAGIRPGEFWLMQLNGGKPVLGSKT